MFFSYKKSTFFFFFSTIHINFIFILPPKKERKGGRGRGGRRWPETKEVITSLFVVFVVGVCVCGWGIKFRLGQCLGYLIYL